jgi:hypothetical protein
VRSTRDHALDPIQAEFVDEACLWLVAPGVGTDRLQAVATEILAEQDEDPELAQVATLGRDASYPTTRDVVGHAIESITGHRLPGEYELSRRALRALCRGTVSGSIAPRELTRWGYNRFVTGGGQRETALLYDLYLLDEDYERLEEGRGRRRRTVHDVDDRVLDFARRVAARS